MVKTCLYDGMGELLFETKRPRALNLEKHHLEVLYQVYSTRGQGSNDGLGLPSGHHIMFNEGVHRENIKSKLLV